MDDPRAFTRTCNIIYGILCLGCIVSFVVSFWGGEPTLIGFPVLFLLAALLNFFSAWLRFRRDIRGHNQKSAGVLFLLGGILLLIICYVTVLCLW